MHEIVPTYLLLLLAFLLPNRSIPRIGPPANIRLLRLPAALDAVAGAKHPEVVYFENLDGLTRDGFERGHGGEVDPALLCGGILFDGVGCLCEEEIMM